MSERSHGLELIRAELRAVIAAECDTLIDCDCGDSPIEARPGGRGHLARALAETDSSDPDR